MKSLFLFALFSSWSIAAIAYCPSSYSSCDYYICAEEHNPCGKQGYWIGWGHRYCQKYLDSEKSFSLEAQQWLRENRQCLQSRAEEISQGTQCSGIRKAAMESHVGCYVETGFCELSFKDKAAILWGLRTALNAPEAWIEGIRLEKACREQGLSSILRY
ncbi:hypothetical protein [Bdellovibrio sp. HCB2-146]|uniref:hypothetical protein n=1 Tax=Bdellovibrio sp. HCB2-146 TaxID=3394362 RepID=UPI0039BC74E7